MESISNTIEISCEELLEDDAVELQSDNDFIFENIEIIRSESKFYSGEIIKIDKCKGKYKDGNDYNRAEVIFKIVDEDGESEAIYTFDLSIPIKSNKKLQILLFNTLGKIPTGKSINIEQLLLRKKAYIKIKNYTNRYSITTAYVTELTKNAV